jgi:hypothetical protein
MGGGQVSGDSEAGPETLRRLTRQRNEARRRAARLAHRVEQAELALNEREADLGYLFVVTYGRSGSTLLQGVLNSIPGYLIRGENHHALQHLFAFHRHCLAAREQFGPHQTLGPDHAWFGMEQWDPETSLRQVRQTALATLLRPAADTRVTGFKEIRWYHPDVQEYVDFLRAAFPGARFVINTRNHDDVARSKWWARHPDAHRQLATMEAGFDQMAARLGESCLRVHYDDYVADPRTLIALFDWLGEPWDESRVATVLATRHSTTSATSTSPSPTGT